MKVFSLWALSSKPSMNMNYSYLEPLIHELELWDGVIVTIRAALSCIACDVPAKLENLLGHGCSRYFRLKALVTIWLQEM